MAHPAAGLLDGLAPHVGGGGQEAPGRRPAAHDAVVGEGLPRHQDGAVKVPGGQADVLHPVGAAGDVGGAAAQHILVELGGEVIHGGGGLGDVQGEVLGGPPVQAVIGRLGGGSIEGDAGVVGLENLSSLVKGGILHRGLHLGQDVSQVQLPREGLLEGDGKLGLGLRRQFHHVAAAQGVQDLSLEGLPVQPAARGAPGEVEGGVVGLPGGLHRVPGQVGFHLVQDAVQAIPALVGGQDLLPAEQAAEVDPSPQGEGIGMPHLPGPLGGGHAVRCDAGQGDLVGLGLPFHRLGGEHHALILPSVPGGTAWAAGLLQGSLGRLLGQAA